MTGFELWEIKLYSIVTIRWKQLISYMSLLMKVKKYIIMQITEFKECAILLL